ncbi:helix-turn-helix transcriptional regulator [Paenibacillus aestuarii]|uniref:Helix-turn-helix domain-containing protein n=1 Tax=Paenibacillus aestuarii TaxID=516965 RepID=A0ABW0KBC7_9BACL|nr:AraC family transcriptional regulator [Paenibacillus aestuarii]
MIHTPTNIALKESGVYARANATDWQFQWPLHTHEGLEIYYFTQGKAHYVIGDNIFDLQPGDMLLFRGDTIHRVNPSQDVPYVRSYVNFMPRLIEQHLPEEMSRKLLALFESASGLLIRWSPDEREEIQRFFQTICTERERETFGFEWMVATHLIQMLIRIYRKSKHLLDLSITRQPTHSQANVTRILQYLNQNFTETISLAGLSKALHLNKYYMCHSFKEVTGYTINNYLMSRRVEEAKRLLISSDQAIGSISEQLGFNTSVHFSRTFKQFAGASPQAFRKAASDRHL